MEYVPNCLSFSTWLSSTGAFSSIKTERQIIPLDNVIKINNMAKAWQAGPVGTPGSLLWGFRTALKQPHEHLGPSSCWRPQPLGPSHSRSLEGLDGGELPASQR